MKRVFIIFWVILIISIIIPVVSNATTIKVNSDKESLYSNEDIKLTINIEELDEEVDVYTGKIVYDSNVFEDIKQSDFSTSGEWMDLVYNEKNGKFVIERTEKAKNSESIFSVNLRTKEKIENKDFEVSLIDNVVSGGEKDINIDETKITIKATQNINNDPENNNNNDANIKGNDIESVKELVSKVSEASALASGTTLDNTKANSILPNTGWKITAVIIALIIVINGGIAIYKWWKIEN